MLANLEVGILLCVSSIIAWSIWYRFGGLVFKQQVSFPWRDSFLRQMISYELAMGLSLLPIFLWVSEPGSGAMGLSLVDIVNSQSNSSWLLFVQPISALIFLIALFAETNRLPFDMPESETDLVGGFHTEYGGFKFGIFFVAEYAHIVVGSAIFTIIFLGGWHFLPWMEDPWQGTG